MIDSKKRKLIQPIKYTRVSTLIAKASEGRSAETYKVVLRDNSQPAYLKLTTTPQQAISELAAAQVGRALGLPIPEPFLVYVQPNKLFTDGESQFAKIPVMLAFASAEASASSLSFARLVKQPSAQNDAALLNWKDAKTTAVFDEWLANPDRNLQNILFSPTDNTYWLIDHGFALCGNHAPEWNLGDPGQETTNIIMDMLLKQIPGNRKLQGQIHKHTCDFMLKSYDLDLSEIDQDGYFKQLSPGLNAETIQQFLTLRIEHVQSLICHKLGIPHLQIV